MLPVTRIFVSPSVHERLILAVRDLEAVHEVVAELERVLTDEPGKSDHLLGQVVDPVERDGSDGRPAPPLGPRRECVRQKLGRAVPVQLDSNAVVHAAVHEANAVQRRDANYPPARVRSIFPPDRHLCAGRIGPNRHERRELRP